MSNNFRQLYVKSAFLNDYLHEEVFMTQPPGFIDEKYLTHECLLQKSFYGLKQSPRAWFQRLSSLVHEIGFTGSKADLSLFYRFTVTDITFILVYVDDLIVQVPPPWPYNP